MTNQKVRIPLLAKLVIAIVLGIVIGSFFPLWFLRAFMTLSGLFSSFLKFTIPLLILAYITIGIANLSHAAGKLLGITAVLAYISTLAAGSLAFLVAINLFPSFMDPQFLTQIQATDSKLLSSYFSIVIDPVISTMSSVALAFVLGLCISKIKQKRQDNSFFLYEGVKDFSEIIDMLLTGVIIPLLPFYICATFAEMSYSGKTFAILGILWKVFLTAIVLHLVYIFIQFFLAGIIARKNPFVMLKNQVIGYTTAVGTQSSAATIPVNLQCAEKNGISSEIRNFAIPLCANIHMAGSMITITCCVTAVLLMTGGTITYSVLIPFIATLGVAMIASPGAPGGAIITSLPFMPMVGIPAEGMLASLLVALYLTQDSFGTACNVSGDNALSVIVDTIYKKFIKK
ncbi:MAG: dicarboxylate/amino acid:cation symporter [Treponemataceae bacterium]